MWTWKMPSTALRVALEIEKARRLEAEIRTAKAIEELKELNGRLLRCKADFEAACGRVAYLDCKLKRIMELSRDAVMVLETVQKTVLEGTSKA